MGPQVLVDYKTVSVALVFAFALVGAAQGGARSVIVGAISLAFIVGLGEPAVASVMLDVGHRVLKVIRRALGTGEPTVASEVGQYYFAIYVGLLIATMFLCRAFVKEGSVSKASRLFGAATGVLNGLLFSLMVREQLLPSLRSTLGPGLTVHIRLGPEAVGASAATGGLMSVGTVAYVFGLLLAGAGVLQKVRGLRGPGP